MAAMRYKLLGRSGLRVSEIALGTMTFGNTEWGADRDESRRVLDAYVEAGGNFIDTASLYAQGESETILGELLPGRRERLVIATKYTLRDDRRPGDPNAAGSHRKNLVQTLETSLRRLRVDYVDLLWVHAWDAMTPTEEVMRGLDDVVRAGKVLYVGVSDTPAWVVSRANMLAELRGWSAFTALQIEYSLVARTPERDLLPMARALDLAVTTWGSLAGGVLTGKYAADRSASGPARYAGNAAVKRLAEKNLAIVDVVKQVAQQAGATPAQVALAWVRGRPGVMIPIVGARTADQLRDSLACLDVRLDDAALAKLDAATAIDLGFPHEMLAGDVVRGLVYNAMRDRIDDHRAS